jgi:hypothetical protein
MKSIAPQAPESNSSEVCFGIIYSISFDLQQWILSDADGCLSSTSFLSRETTSTKSGSPSKQEPEASITYMRMRGKFPVSLPSESPTGLELNDHVQVC